MSLFFYLFQQPVLNSNWIHHILNKHLVINFNSSLTGPFLKSMPLGIGADGRIRQWALRCSLGRRACRTDVKARHDVWTRCRQLDGWRSAVGVILHCCWLGLHAQPSIFSYCRHTSNITDASLCASSFFSVSFHSRSNQRLMIKDAANRHYNDDHALANAMLLLHNLSLF